MKFDRLLAITMILMNKKRVTAKELAQNFEVSIRTIYRDIESICAAGLPVVTYHGRSGGFCLIEDYKIAGNLLTTDEILSSLIALNGLGKTIEDNTISNAIEKIRGLLPQEKLESLKTLQKELIMDLKPWWENDTENKKMKTIRKAIRSSLLIGFTYTNNRGEVINRRIEPMSLVFKRYDWYLFGYCLLRDDYRFFKLSRMRKIVPTDLRFERRKKELSISSVEKELDWKEEPVNIVIRFDPQVRVMAEDVFGFDNLELNDDNSGIARVEWPEDNWVYSTLLGFGEYIEVLKPESVRNEIIKRSKAVIERYSKS